MIDASTPAGASAALPPVWSPAGTVWSASSPLAARSAARLNDRTRRTLIDWYRSVDPVVALLVLVGAFVATNLGRMPAGIEEFLTVRFTVRNLVLVGLFALVWPIILTSLRLYDPDIFDHQWDEFRGVLLASTFGAMLASVFTLFSRTNSFRPETIISFWLGLTGAMLLMRLSTRRLLSSTQPRELRTVLIVGSGPRAWRLYRRLRERWLGRTAE